MAESKQSKPLRNESRGTTVVPFPREYAYSLENRKVVRVHDAPKIVLPKTQKAKGPRLILRSVKRLKLHKLNAAQSMHIGKSFIKIKNEVESEIMDLLSFLPEEEAEARDVFIKTFDHNIAIGRIRSIEQLYTFLQKAKELAHCLKLCLEKNEYSDNFMREISFDVFENGFAPNNQSEVEKKYPNYFR